MNLETKEAKALLNKCSSIAIAESLSGGLICNLLTNVPGSSRFLHLGIVAYSNDSKIKTLKVSPETIKKHGAVSEQTAIEMANGIRKLHKTEFGLSTTGIAGPGGGTKRKPVGFVYIAVATKNETLCIKYMFEGERLSIKRQTTRHALLLLLEFLT